MCGRVFFSLSLYSSSVQSIIVIGQCHKHTNEFITFVWWQTSFSCDKPKWSHVAGTASGVRGTCARQQRRWRYGGGVCVQNAYHGSLQYYIIILVLPEWQRNCNFVAAAVAVVCRLAANQCHIDRNAHTSPDGSRLCAMRRHACTYRATITAGEYCIYIYRNRFRIVP